MHAKLSIYSPTVIYMGSTWEKCLRAGILYAWDLVYLQIYLVTVYLSHFSTLTTLGILNQCLSKLARYKIFTKRV